MATQEGLEPSTRESKSHVLPLHHRVAPLSLKEAPGLSNPPTQGCRSYEQPKIYPAQPSCINKRTWGRIVEPMSAVRPPERKGRTGG